MLVKLLIAKIIAKTNKFFFINNYCFFFAKKQYYIDYYPKIYDNNIVRALSIAEGVISIAYVKVDDNDSLEKAIKKFKRMVEKEGIIREWKKREYFEKPSTIKNRKKKSLERKRLKKLRKMQQMNKNS